MTLTRTTLCSLTMLSFLALCACAHSTEVLSPETKAPILTDLTTSPGSLAFAGVSQILRSMSINLPEGAWEPSVDSRQLKGDLGGLYANAAPAIVMLTTDLGQGSGFVVDSDGWIITNDHVVKDGRWDPKSGALEVRVHLGQLESHRMRLMNEVGFRALVYRRDDRKDLALLRLAEKPQGIVELPALTVAESDPLIGQDCVALGHPAVGTLWTTRGCNVTGMGSFPRDLTRTVARYVIALGWPARGDQDGEDIPAGEPLREVVQSDCSVFSGDSGGPLLSGEGKVIGVTFGGPPGDAAQDVGSAGFSYHIHVKELREFMTDRPERPPLHIPDPWPVGPVCENNIDLDEDGTVDTLAFYFRPNLPQTGLLVDLDQDTKEKFTADQRRENTCRAMDFEYALQRLPYWRAFYDSDNDGMVDLIFEDVDRDGRADFGVRRLESGAWVLELTVIPKMAVTEAMFSNRDIAELVKKKPALVKKLQTFLARSGKPSS